MYVPHFRPYGYSCDTQVNQAANGLTSSNDTLADLLERIEHVLSRLNIFTRIPITHPMNEIMVKIIVELLSTLALATNQLKQGRREFVLRDVLPYSVQSSEIWKQVSWRD